MKQLLILLVLLLCVGTPSRADVLLHCHPYQIDVTANGHVHCVASDRGETCVDVEHNRAYRWNVATGVVHALRLGDLSSMWQQTFRNLRLAWMVDAGVTVVVDDGPDMVALKTLDGRSGAVLKSLVLQTPGRQGGDVTIVDDTPSIWILQGAGQVWANDANGRIRWTRATVVEPVTSQLLLERVTDGWYFVEAESGRRVGKLNSSNFTLRGADGHRFFYSTGDRLHAATDTKELWSSTLADAVVTTDGANQMIATQKHLVACLDAKTGRVLWQNRLTVFPIGPDGFNKGRFIAENPDSGDVVALDVTNGKTVWTLPAIHFKARRLENGRLYGITVRHNVMWAQTYDATTGRLLHEEPVHAKYVPSQEV